MLTFALVCLALPIPAFVVGTILGGQGPDADLLYFIPFAITCCLAAFAILVFWSHAGTNRALSSDEKRRWRWLLFFGWPVAAPLYWLRFR